MEFTSYKIIGRNPKTNRQQKKRIYTSREDYLKYKDDLTNRYKTYMNVEHHGMFNGKWECFKKVAYDGSSEWRFK